MIYLISESLLLFLSIGSLPISASISGSRQSDPKQTFRVHRHFPLTTSDSSDDESDSSDNNYDWTNEGNEDNHSKNEGKEENLSCEVADCFGCIVHFDSIDCKIGNRLFRLLLHALPDTSRKNSFVELF